MPELSMDQLVEVQEIKLLRQLDDLTGLLEIMVFLAKFDKANISNFIKECLDFTGRCTMICYS